MSRKPTPGMASPELREQALQTRESTKQHLKAAVAITSATEELGGQTLSELSRQGETIERTTRKIDEIDAQAAKSKFMLAGMKSIWGTIKNKFKAKPVDTEEFVERKAAERRAKDGTSSSAAGRAGTSTSTASAGSAGAGSQRQLQQNVGAHTAEEDELLDQISSNLSRIGEIGHAMGAELNKQDKMLDGLSAATDKVAVKVKENTKEARRIAR